MSNTDNLEIKKSVSFKELDGLEIILIDYDTADKNNIIIQYNDYTLNSYRRDENDYIYRIITPENKYVRFGTDYKVPGLSSGTFSPDYPELQTDPVTGYIRIRDIEKVLEQDGIKSITSYKLRYSENGDTFIVKTYKSRSEKNDYSISITPDAHGIANISNLFVYGIGFFHTAFKDLTLLDTDTLKEYGLSELFDPVANVNSFFKAYSSQPLNYSDAFNKTFKNIDAVFDEELKNKKNDFFKIESIVIESQNRIKTKQLLEATSEKYCPDENGMITIPIKQEIKKKNNPAIKTKGELVLYNQLPAYKDEDVEKILLFKYDEIEPLPLSTFSLTNYDGRVFQAVCTLIDRYIDQYPDQVDQLTGDCAIPLTFQQIIRAMGNPKKHIKVSKEIKIDITKSMLKLFSTKLFHEWEEELKARHLDKNELIALYGKQAMLKSDRTITGLDGEQVEYKEITHTMLAGDIVRLTPRNAKIDKKTGSPETTTGFIIKKIPPLYIHAKITKKIATIPLDWYEIKAFKRMTEQRIGLIAGISERIISLYYYRSKGENPHNSNYNIINLENMLKANGVSYTTKQHKSRIIKEIETILKEFKEDKKNIKDFKLLDNGRSVTGIKITI